MNCTEVRQRMDLRDDECDPRELAEMHRHCSTCPECAAEYSRVIAGRKLMSTLQHQIPTLSHPQLLTSSVLERIEQASAHEASKASGTWLDRLAAWLDRPALTWAMASALLAITGSFAIEYTSAYVSVKVLEDHVQQQSALRAESDMAAIHQSALVDAVATLTKKLSGNPSYMELSQNWVMIDKASLERLFQLYDELKANASKLPPEFRSANPSITKLLDAKRPSTQLELLLKEREALIRELNRLMPKERK